MLVGFSHMPRYWAGKALNRPVITKSTEFSHKNIITTTLYQHNNSQQVQATIMPRDWAGQAWNKDFIILSTEKE